VEKIRFKQHGNGPTLPTCLISCFKTSRTNTHTHTHTHAHTNTYVTRHCNIHNKYCDKSVLSLKSRKMKRVLIKTRPQNSNAFLALHSAYMRPVIRVNNIRYSRVNF